MQRLTIQISKLLLSLSLSLSLITFNGVASAAILKIENIPLGKVIKLNGQKFVKIGNDLVSGSQFVALEKAKLPCIANQFDGMNMQDFTTSDCECLKTPTGTNYTLAGVMRDSRDGKSYEIRKFSDGKCWTVDNLAYGGTSDACAGKTTFAGNANLSGAAWGYGDCRNNPGSSTYGYLYNWQAAMQHTSAYYGVNYAGPTTNVQGICPPGWHIPAGNISGEFQALHVQAGSTVVLWQVGGSWKGVLSGNCAGSGNLSPDGMYFWTSTQADASTAYYHRVDTAYGVNQWNQYKNNGFSVRCIRN